MNRRERERFDALVERVIGELPGSIRALLDEVPVVVLDRPTSAMLRSLGIDPADEEEAGSLCGLHSGLSITERSPANDSGTIEDIHLFREGIVSLAGGFERTDEGGGEEAVLEEIRITLLHEIGHHFGLDEDDLERLGYD